MKNKVSSLIAEGILFCGSGILLLSYSLISYAKAFNKSWSQSPYLFPVLVGAALIGLSIWIMGQGVLAMKRVGNGITLKEKTDSKGKMARVLGVLVLCGLYYLVLGEVSIPRVTISIFEVATVIFLIAMMWFMKVRKVAVLVLVPIGTSLFLSIAFRTCLHVMLP